MLTRLGHAAWKWGAVDPWTNVYGLSRTLLAVGTAGTLIFSSPDTMFRPALGVPPAPYCFGATRISLFCLVPHGQLGLARWLAVAILAVVASGWRPRLTAIPHWWVAFSLAVTMTIPDGGDQVTQNLTLLLLPAALTDSRRWHWQGLSPEASAKRSAGMRLIALTALLAVRLQVAGIYFNSSVAKLAVPEWVDGTALYYWTTDPSFGVPGWLHGLILPIVTGGLGVVAMTWGTLILEFILGLGLVMPKRFWKYLLPAGIAFHVGIALMMGLVSFSIAMTAALILYLRPVDEAFPLPVLWRRIQAWALAGEARLQTGGAPALAHHAIAQQRPAR